MHIPKISVVNTPEEKELEKSSVSAGDSGENIQKNSERIFTVPKLKEKTRFEKPDGEEDKKNLEKKSRFNPACKKKLKIAGVFIFFTLLFMGIVFIKFFNIYKKANDLKLSSDMLINAVNEQDMNLVKEEIANTKESFEEFSKAYSKITWLKFMPYVGSYISDGQHALKAGKHGFNAVEIIVETVEPYTDIIGFSSGKSSGPESGEETTQDRLDFIVYSIPDIIPKMEEIKEEVNIVKKEIEKIDTEKYPEELFGYSLKPKIHKGMDLVGNVADMIIRGKPLLEAAPYILGSEEERKYLVLFQNDKELRPTGGFLTAYSIAKVYKGKFEPVVSDDIYNLDDKYRPVIEAPYPIVKFLRGPYLISKNLRLRDMNWSPDFTESMELFVKEIKKVGIDDIDGIIAVDTQLLVNILDVMGPIGVPGYGEFSTEIIPECNCPQVIYELESFADIEGPIVWSENEPGKIVFAPPNYDNRKKIIGPLMNSILSNLLGQPKEKVPALFEAVLKSLNEKSILFYFIDEDARLGAESFKIAGRMEDYPDDYLHINDANLGGRKSNLYVRQEVDQVVEIGKDKSIVKTLTITYKNPEEYDGWLNSILPNWVRIYVPLGSELLDFEGFLEEQEPYEEFGKSVFAGHFELRPKGVVRLTVRYKLPYKLENDYRLFIQKQPGTDPFLYTISVNDKEDEFFLDKDREIRVRI